VTAATASRTPLVEMKGLVKQFPGVLAVDGADLEIYPREVLGLVGKNGAGKSTMIKMLAGAERPDAGEIVLDGAPLPEHYGPHSAHHLGLAFMHQELQTVPLLSVTENVALGARFPRRAGVSIAWRSLRRSVASVLAELDADIDLTARLGELSQAQQRLVMIARALYHRAKVLVLDEPSASLSDVEVGHLHAVVRRLRDGGTAVVYVSHRLREIVELTDRVVVMRDGRVVLERPTAGLDHRQLVDAIVGDRETRTGIEERRERARSGPSLGGEILRVRDLTRPGTAGGVDFEVRAGEILGLGGLVGSGRSELVRMLAGVDPMAAGRIEVKGRPAAVRSPRHARKAGIALLPEDRRNEGLVLDFSVRENVTLASLSRFRTAGLPMPSRSRERAATREMIERLDIRTSSTETKVGTLSGGNQQKVVLARWLELPVDVFVFDEPTAGIDVHAKAELFSLIEDLADAQKGVILITSDFAELVAICDRVIVLREGRVTGAVAGEEITEQAIVELCYAHEPAIETAA
jgi:ABC-type sugar transport system ATPase subunit